MNAVRLEELMELYGDSIYRFCRKVTYSKSDAEDLYQETFLKAFEKIHKIDMDSNPRAYLTSICIILWKSSKRKYARRAEIAPIASIDDLHYEPASADMENQIIDREMNRYLSEEIENLNEKYRMVLYLYYTLGFSVEEIAMAAKIPKGTVKSRLFKARKILKRKLEGIWHGERQYS